MKKAVSAGNDSIQVVCTQGAPLATPALGRFPSNVATVIGAPGTSVYASLSYPAVFDTGALGDTFFTIDQTGSEVLRFRADSLEDENLQSMDLRAVTFAAYPEYRPDLLVSSTVVFGNYRIAAQPNIWCYGYATGAAADGISPCSIYVILEKLTDKPFTSFNLSLDNGAKVVGGKQIASPATGTAVFNVPFSTNGYGAADIVCDHVANVRGVITLPDSNDGDLVVVKLSFLAIPVAKSLARKA